jgi:hypothetical protein
VKDDVEQRDAARARSQIGDHVGRRRVGRPQPPDIGNAQPAEDALGRVRARRTRVPALGPRRYAPIECR